MGTIFWFCVGPPSTQITLSYYASQQKWVNISLSGPTGRDDTVFAISVWPITLTGSGAQCILCQTVVEFTEKASPVDGLPGPSNECQML